MDLVGLTGADSRDATPEYSVTPEAPEARERGSVEHRLQSANDSSCSGHGDSDDDSDDELPPLTELLSQASGKRFRARFDLDPQSAISEQTDGSRNNRSGVDAEVTVTSDADTAVDAISGCSQDNPIVVNESDDEEDDGHDAAASGRNEPTFESASSADRLDPPSMSDLPSESIVNGVHGTQNSEPEQILQDREGEEDSKEKLDRSSRHTEHTEGGTTYDGVCREAPASSGHIYDIFAEFEKSFGMNGVKQKPQKQTLRARSPHDSSDHRGLPEPPHANSVSDEQHPDVANDDPDPSCFPGAGSTQESTSEPRQDSEGQVPFMEDIRIDCPTSSGLQERTLNSNAPLPSHAAADDTVRSSPGSGPRNVSAGKRPRQSPESVTPSPGDPASKRPRRVTKESWKAKEA